VLEEDARDARLLARYERLLSPDERNRCARLHLAEARLRYVVGRALVRTMLSRQAEVEPERWVFRSNEHGRPEIAGPVGVPPLSFNLSHTAGLVACGVTVGKAIGVDVECADRRLRWEAIARRFFAADEVRALSRVPEADRASAFFRLWTLKEAYVKARGMGLTLPLRQFSVADDEPRSIAIRFDPALGDDPRRWALASFRPSARHVLAFAVERETGRDVAVELARTVPLEAAADGAAAGVSWGVHRLVLTPKKCD
jgi:4'-phosphopantetheinyl transferase